MKQFNNPPFGLSKRIDYGSTLNNFYNGVRVVEHLKTLSTNRDDRVRNAGESWKDASPEAVMAKADWDRETTGIGTNYFIQMLLKRQQMLEGDIMQVDKNLVEQSLEHTDLDLQQIESLNDFTLPRNTKSLEVNFTGLGLPTVLIAKGCLHAAVRHHGDRLVKGGQAWAEDMPAGSKYSSNALHLYAETKTGSAVISTNPKESWSIVREQGTLHSYPLPRPQCFHDVFDYWTRCYKAGIPTDRDKANELLYNDLCQTKAFEEAFQNCVLEAFELAMKVCIYSEIEFYKDKVVVPLITNNKGAQRRAKRAKAKGKLPPRPKFRVILLPVEHKKTSKSSKISETGTGIKRRFLGRRGHFRLLSSERFTHKRGQWVEVRPSFGPNGEIPKALFKVKLSKAKPLGENLLGI